MLCRINFLPSWLGFVGSFVIQFFTPFRKSFLSHFEFYIIKNLLVKFVLFQKWNESWMGYLRQEKVSNFLPFLLQTFFRNVALMLLLLCRGISSLVTTSRAQRRRADIGETSMTDMKTSACRRNFGTKSLIGQKVAANYAGTTNL